MANRFMEAENDQNTLRINTSLEGKDQLWINSLAEVVFDQIKQDIVRGNPDYITHGPSEVIVSGELFSFANEQNGDEVDITNALTNAPNSHLITLIDIAITSDLVANKTPAIIMSSDNQSRFDCSQFSYYLKNDPTCIGKGYNNATYFRKEREAKQYKVGSPKGVTVTGGVVNLKRGNTVINFVPINNINVVIVDSSKTEDNVIAFSDEMINYLKWKIYGDTSLVSIFFQEYSADTNNTDTTEEEAVEGEAAAEEGTTETVATSSLSNFSKAEVAGLNNYLHQSLNNFLPNSLQGAIQFTFNRYKESLTSSIQEWNKLEEAAIDSRDVINTVQSAPGMFPLQAQIIISPDMVAEFNDTYSIGAEEEEVEEETGEEEVEEVEGETETTSTTETGETNEG